MISYEENPEYNPIYNNEVLRNTLTGNADVQKEPVIVSDDFHMFYVCVKWESIYYMMGPFSTQVMSRIERHRFYRFYGIDEKWEKGLHAMDNAKEALSAAAEATSFVLHCVTAAVYAFPGTRVMLSTNASPYLRYTLGNPFSSLTAKLMSIPISLLFSLAAVHNLSHISSVKII